MPSVRFLVILHIQSIPENSEHNNNGFFMVPGSSNQRVRQKVEFYLINKVSKNIKVTRVKWCSPSRWMIFLTLTINERLAQGEEEELEFYTRTETTSYETPNGWRIKKFIPRVSSGPQEENYDMYMHNFGISNGIIIEHSDNSHDRLDDSDSIHSESIDDRLVHDIINEVRTSINPRNRVDIIEPVFGIPVREVN
jgi:hypothetical protein